MFDTSKIGQSFAPFTMDILTMETRYVNQHDQHVLTSRTTIVVRE